MRVVGLTDVMAEIVPCSEPFAQPKWVIMRPLKLVNETFTPSYNDHKKVMDFLKVSEEKMSFSDDEATSELMEHKTFDPTTILIIYLIMMKRVQRAEKNI